MLFINDPWKRSWIQIAEDLRNLQNTVDLYEKRFKAADQTETADELEKCIHILMRAEGAATTLHLKQQD